MTNATGFPLLESAAPSKWQVPAGRLNLRFRKTVSLAPQVSTFQTPRFGCLQSWPTAPSAKQVASLPSSVETVARIIYKLSQCMRRCQHFANSRFVRTTHSDYVRWWLDPAIALREASSFIYLETRSKLSKNYNFCFHVKRKAALERRLATVLTTQSFASQKFSLSILVDFEICFFPFLRMRIQLVCLRARRYIHGDDAVCALASKRFHVAKQ